MNSQSKLERLTYHPVFASISVIISLILLLASIGVDYIDHDLIIYSFVGRGIYEFGAFPFDFAFDHKPILVYFIYGPLYWLIGHGANYYLLLSLGMLAILILMYRRYLKLQRLALAFTAPLVAIAFIDANMHTGNTEALLVPLCMGSILAIFTFGTGRKGVCLSVIAAFAAINVNYSIFPPLAVTVFYAIITQSRNWRHVVEVSTIYWVSLIFLAMLSFTIFWALGMDVWGYLKLQGAFLGGYSDFRRTPNAGFISYVVISIMIASTPFFVRKRLALTERYTAISVLIFIIVNTVLFALNGKFWGHYLWLVGGPAILSVLIYVKYARRDSSVITVGAVILVLAVIFSINEKYNTFEATDTSASEFYAELHQHVSNKEVMSLSVSIVPVAYGGGIPSHPFVWPDHAATIMGSENASEYFFERIQDSPSFIVTSEHYCDSGNDSLCSAIREQYNLIDRKVSSPYPWVGELPGYDLYQFTGSST